MSKERESMKNRMFGIHYGTQGAAFKGGSASFERKLPHIVHPANSFANSVGVESWSQLLAKMDNGFVAVGTARMGTKSSIGFFMLVELFNSVEGLVHFPHGDKLIVGYPANFSDSIRQAYAEYKATVRSRLEQYMMEGLPSPSPQPSRFAQRADNLNKSETVHVSERTGLYTSVVYGPRRSLYASPQQIPKTLGSRLFKGTK